jgi:DNA-binding transcriptional MerR regulator
MSDSPVALLRIHAKHAPWNARGLASHASARATPSARAIRFYVASGLLDHPEGKGTAATYHYKHLLQLLAIKIRQREGQTLDAIKAELSGVQGDQLEKRVAASLAPALGNGLAAPSRAEDEGPATWQRIAVADGVEIHVRSDSPAAHESGFVAMREALRAALGREELR